MKKLILISGLLFLSSCIRVDESMKLFFPKNLTELQSVQTEFSAFWWNFVIIDSVNGATPDLATSEKICENLKTKVGAELRMVFCGSSVLSAQKILNSWSEDYIYRKKLDPKEFFNNKALLDNSALQASFISDKGLFNMMRFDPFQAWQDYVEISKNAFIDSFEKKSGFLIDTKTARVIIPLQFQLRPQLENIEPVIKILNEFKSAFLVGSHGSTYRNEKQVRDDLSVVSIISAIAFFGFILILAIRSRINTLFLIVPVSVAMYLATLLTQFIYGSVHGLTLAFGSGIVGLALDYGLHGAFGAEAQQTWKSNTIGILTTLCGVCVLMMSGIPLIKQMMIFSTIGLIFGFILFYFMFKFFSDYFKIKSLDFYLPQVSIAKWAIIVFIVFGFYGVYKSEMTMDLRKLSFVSEKESNLTTWFFTRTHSGESFLLIKDFNKVDDEVFKEASWSKVNGIEYEGIAKYLPDLKTQNDNFKSWIQNGCEFFNQNSSVNIQKIFKPYVEYICSLKVDKPNQIQSYKDKAYLNHLIGHDQILSIFTSHDEKQAQLISQQYPEAKSLTQALKNFSSSLESDLRWMIPVSLLLTLMILAFYYRNAKAVFSSLVPFLAGLGLYFTVAFMFKIDVDLISILGLVMVFGFSVDYGVFSTDVHLYSNTEKRVKSVYSALTFAAVTNILGFLPMLFAGHPVLSRLGSALFFGTVGTYLGTIYGVYSIYQKDILPSGD